MWISNGKVVEEEHAVEWFGEELDLTLLCQLAALEDILEIDAPEHIH